jgi:hypothetical protein
MPNRWAGREGISSCSLGRDVAGRNESNVGLGFEGKIFELRRGNH